MSHPHLPTTQSAVRAVEELAARHGREVRAQHDIGRDRTFAGLAGNYGGDGEPAPIPHEALLEFGGRPEIAVRLFTHDEAVVTLDGIAFDVQRDSVPAFLDSVWSGLVHVKARTFPPSTTMIVTVPGEPGYRESVSMRDLTPWIAGLIR
ncbi:hypothetical protein [Kitasatospora sp. NPDC087314]|uniref:hypothetical protein n=1 Tax=Kitasatospora sp. NPDC087314 TaxID=3364068 RepID=UPI0038278E99